MIATALSNMLPGRMAADYSPLSSFWYSPVGSASTSGVNVKPDNALAVSSVFACVRLLREVFGSLPFRVYRRTGERTTEQAPDYPLWDVLHNRPNRWQTPMEWKEMGVVHLLLRGNFYCRQVINSYGELELVPLCPDRVTVEQTQDRSLRYKHHPVSGQVETINQDDMFHVKGLSTNGVVGVSVLEFARNAVGASIVQESYGSSLFKNGGLPTFWISRPQGVKFTTEARKNFREGWRKLHAGPENAGNPPIMEDGMELHELGLTSRDSQWIEARGFGAEEICRFFGVSPHLIGVKSSAPLGSIEQQSLEFVTYTLGPMAVRWEQTANRDLLVDPKTYYTKIVMDALLRGDLLSRYQAHNIAVQGGWMLGNEVRALEDRNPIEGGDVPRWPSNMQPAGGAADWNEQGGQPGKGKPKAKPKQQPAEEEDEETAYQKRKAANQAAFGVLLEEAAQRIAAHEIRGLSARADKAAEDRPKWNQWAIAFYQEKHQPYATKALDPICAAWLTQTGVKHSPADLAVAFCLSVGHDFDSDIPAVLEGWKLTRAGVLASQFKRRFFDA